MGSSAAMAAVALGILGVAEAVQWSGTTSQEASGQHSCLAQCRPTRHVGIAQPLLAHAFHGQLGAHDLNSQHPCSCCMATLAVNTPNGKPLTHAADGQLAAHVLHAHALVCAAQQPWRSTHQVTGCSPMPPMGSWMHTSCTRTPSMLRLPSVWHTICTMSWMVTAGRKWTRRRCC